MDQSSSRPLAVVTGASSGIGLELARQFAEHDFDLLIAAEDAGILHAAADALRAHSEQIEPVQADLARCDGVDQLYQRIKAVGQPLDAIAINAGVGVGGGSADR